MEDIKKEKYKVVLITGASDGIGREIALRYSKRKFHKYILFFFSLLFLYF